MRVSDLLGVNEILFSAVWNTGIHFPKFVISLRHRYTQVANQHCAEELLFSNIFCNRYIKMMFLNVNVLKNNNFTDITNSLHKIMFLKP